MNKLLCLLLVIVSWIAPAQSLRFAIDLQEQLAKKDTAAILNLRSSADAAFREGLSVAVYPLFYSRNFNVEARACVHFKLNALNKAQLVLQIAGASGSTLAWESAGLIGDSVAKIKMACPRNLPKDAVIKAYVWNPQHNLLQVNALQIKIDTLYEPNYSAWSKQVQAAMQSCPNGNQGILPAQLINYKCCYFVKWRVVDSLAAWHEFMSADFKLTGPQTASGGLCLLQTPISAVAIKSVASSANGISQYEVRTTSAFNKNVEIEREALIFQLQDSTGKLDEMYRSNAKIDTSQLERMYWLNKGGLQWHNDKCVLLTYHNTGISSLQCDTYLNLLTFNLDYALDHPLLHFPLLDSSKNYFEDISCSSYKKGDSAQHCFQFFISEKAHHFEVPRLMDADYTDLRTQRAVYFGNEDVHKAKHAVGGFAKYHIPVTKSVFYSNPTHFKNIGLFESSEIACIKSTHGYLAFLKELYKAGNEICLHTASEFTDQAAETRSACQWMQSTFKSCTWIDHGYDNASASNREDLVCDGLVKGSPYFIGDILQQSGVKYLWNGYFEDAALDYRQFTFNNELQSPFAGFGNFLPTPHFYLHATRSGNFYHFATYNLFLPDGMMDYYFNESRLLQFISSFGTSIVHFYPCSAKPSHRLWQVNTKTQKLEIAPAANMALQNIANLRERGLLVGTIAEMGAYWSALDKVSIVPVGENKFIVRNDGQVLIEGLNLIALAKKVKITGSTFSSKPLGQEQVFWFDLAPLEEKTIELEK